LTGATQGISWVDIRGDGRQLAAASLDGSVRVWDLPPVEEPRVLWPAGNAEPDQRPAWVAEFSPEGRLLATAGAFGVIHIYDTHTLSELEPIQNHRGLCCLRFDRSGERLVSVSLTEGMVRVWSVTDHREIAQHFIGVNDARGHRAPRAACFGRDRDHVAITSFDGVLSLWDIRNKEPQPHRLGDELARSGLCDIAYDANQGQYAVASEEGCVWLVDGDDGSASLQFAGHEGSVLGVDCRAADNILVSQTTNDVGNGVRFWPLDPIAAARSELHAIAGQPGTR
jgi:WD40 repeat protein